MGLDLALLLVACAWGTTYLGAKTVLASMSVPTLLGLRFGIATLLLLPFVVRSLSSLSLDRWRSGIQLGLLLTLSIAIETIGIRLESPTNAGVLIAMTILFVPVLERFAYGTARIGPLVAPVLISFLGCALMTMRGGTMPSLGDLLILIAAGTRALHLVASKRAMADGRGDPGVLSVVQLACVAFAGLGASLAGGSLGADITSAPPQVWVILVYLAAGCTVFAFYVQTRAVRCLPATRVGLLLGTEPAFAAMTGAVFGGDRLTALAWVGIALVVGATGWGRIRTPSGAT